MSEPTKCFLLTGVGRAAIAVVVVEGPNALSCLMESFRPAVERPFTDGQVRYGTWGGSNNSDSEPGESVVVVPVACPPIRETEALRRFEIHCHGGVAAAERLLQDLEWTGVLRGQADASCDSDPHFGSTDLLVSQAKEVLAKCTTETTAAIAMHQVNGAMVRWRDASRLRIDGAEGTKKATADLASVAEEAARILRLADVGRHLAVPWNIVLAGPPNVGKSSLINAIVGFDRSIIMDMPGTTRDVLDAETVFDGWPLRLRDTAGLRDTAITGDTSGAVDAAGLQKRHDQIEHAGISRARAAIEEADLIVSVTEPGKERLDLGDNLSVPVIEVLNKSDLLDRSAQDPNVDGKAVLPTAATTGQGVTSLLQQILSQLVGESLQHDHPIPVCESQVRWLQRIVNASDDVDQMRVLFRGRVDLEDDS